VVSFLNARPLIEGLDAEPGVRLDYAVPSALAGMLRSGQVDVALIPVIDLARETGSGGSSDDGTTSWRRISDACIGSDGETMTVRVFSRVPPERMSTLHVDGDSHTSIALAQLLWSRYFKRRLTLVPLEGVMTPGDCESVLLIGDKVVTKRPCRFPHEIDLGAAWKEWTGLPFVFAVWVLRADRAGDHWARLLNDARDRGVARAAELAAKEGPALGWPVDLARQYLTERLIYTITPAAHKGMQRFLELAAEEGIIAPSRRESVS